MLYVCVRACVRLLVLVTNKYIIRFKTSTRWHFPLTLLVGHTVLHHLQYTARFTVKQQLQFACDRGHCINLYRIVLTYCTVLTGKLPTDNNTTSSYLSWEDQIRHESIQWLQHGRRGAEMCSNARQRVGLLHLSNRQYTEWSEKWAISHSQSKWRRYIFADKLAKSYSEFIHLSHSAVTTTATAVAVATERTALQRYRHEAS